MGNLNGVRLWIDRYVFVYALCYVVCVSHALRFGKNINYVLFLNHDEVPLNKEMFFWGYYTVLVSQCQLCPSQKYQILFSYFQIFFFFFLVENDLGISFFSFFPSAYCILFHFQCCSRQHGCLFLASLCTNITNTIVDTSGRLSFYILEQKVVSWIAILNS